MSAPFTCSQFKPNRNPSHQLSIDDLRTMLNELEQGLFYLQNRCEAIEQVQTNSLFQFENDKYLKQNNKENQNGANDFECQLIFDFTTNLLVKLQVFAESCDNHVSVEYPTFDVERWLGAQKQEQYGGCIDLNLLFKLGKKFQTLTNILYDAVSYVYRLSDLLQTLRQNRNPNIPNNTNYLQTIKIRLFSLLYDLLNDSSMVTSHLSVVVRAKNKISVNLGLIGATEKFGFNNQNPIATCQLITFEEANRLKLRKNDEKVKRLDTFPETNISHHSGEMAYYLDERTHLEASCMNNREIWESQGANDNLKFLQFKFGPFKLSKNPKHESGQAAKQRYVLAFRCGVRLFERQVEFLSFSLPFRLSEHPNMDLKLWTAAMDDVIFMDCHDETKRRSNVKWSELMVYLRCCFSAILCGNLERNKPTKASHRPLKSWDFPAIKLRLLNGVIDNSEILITHDQIFENKMKHIPYVDSELPFTFFEWFFCKARMLQKSADRETKNRVHEMWNKYLIEGFVSQGDAETKLRQERHMESAFLLRFCTNHADGIAAVISTVYEVRGEKKMHFQHHKPWLISTKINDQNPLPLQIMKSKSLSKIKYILSCKPRTSETLLSEEAPALTIEAQAMHSHDILHQSIGDRLKKHHLPIQSNMPLNSNLLNKEDVIKPLIPKSKQKETVATKLDLRTYWYIHSQRPKRKISTSQREEHNLPPVESIFLSSGPMYSYYQHCSSSIQSNTRNPFPVPHAVVNHVTNDVNSNINFPSISFEESTFEIDDSNFMIRPLSSVSVNTETVTKSSRSDTLNTPQPYPSRR